MPIAPRACWSPSPRAARSIAASRWAYLEALLRERFGETQPQAVATIITAARQPVTLRSFRKGCRRPAPGLTGGGPDQNWWAALQGRAGRHRRDPQERHAVDPSPTERLRRATRRLEAGQVDVALAEVLRMPGRDQGQRMDCQGPALRVRRGARSTRSRPRPCSSRAKRRSPRPGGHRRRPRLRFVRRPPSKDRNWSGRRDSNPRPQPWQGCALPLSYARSAAEPERPARVRRRLLAWALGPGKPR